MNREWSSTLSGRSLPLYNSDLLLNHSGLPLCSSVLLPRHTRNKTLPSSLLLLLMTDVLLKHNVFWTLRGKWTTYKSGWIQPPLSNLHRQFRYPYLWWWYSLRYLYWVGTFRFPRFRGVGSPSTFSDPESKSRRSQGKGNGSTIYDQSFTGLTNC